MYILRNNFDWCRDHHQWGTNKKQNGWSTQRFGQPLALLTIKIIMGNCAFFQSDDHDPHHKRLLPSISIMMVMSSLSKSSWHLHIYRSWTTKLYNAWFLHGEGVLNSTKNQVFLFVIYSRGFWYKKNLKKGREKKETKVIKSMRKAVIFQREEEKAKKIAWKSSIVPYKIRDSSMSIICLF